MGQWVLHKGLGWKERDWERERDGLRRRRENGKKKGRGRYHRSWLQHQSIWWGMQAPGMHVYPGFVVLFIVDFPCSGAKFLTFYGNELSRASHSCRPFGKWLRAFRDFGCSWSPFKFHTCSSASLLFLSCTLLCLAPGTRTRTFVLSYFHMAPFSSHGW